MSFTKYSHHPTRKICFEYRLEDLLHLLSLWTALYRYRRHSYAHAKPRAIQFVSEQKSSKQGGRQSVKTVGFVVIAEKYAFVKYS